MAARSDDLTLDASSTVEAIYSRIAPIYDIVYGALLQPGRSRAMARLAPLAGESILEVGVGTGFGLLEYPDGCRVVAIDLSAPMIGRARTRLARRSINHVRLSRMDAAHLAFPDGSFDAVYAPYVINVVPAPARVAHEMLRVCRPGGRLVFLNHFENAGTDSLIGRLVGGVASALTRVDWHLDFQRFVSESGLTPRSIEAVNLGGVSSVVCCVKP